MAYRSKISKKSHAGLLTWTTSVPSLPCKYRETSAPTAGPSSGGAKRQAWKIKVAHMHHFRQHKCFPLSTWGDGEAQAISVAFPAQTNTRAAENIAQSPQPPNVRQEQSSYLVSYSSECKSNL